MTIIESVKNYFLSCPYLKDLTRFGVEFLPENPNTCSVEEVPVTNPIISKNIDGSSSRQFVFVFATRLNYSDEIRNNIENSGLYENIYNWLEENSNNDVLPELDDGLIPTKIECLTNGYLFDISGDLSNARYQIQCRLLYDKD